MGKNNLVKGTEVIFLEKALWLEDQYVKLLSLARAFGYRPMILPTMMLSNLMDLEGSLKNSLISFKDKSNRDISLRPEGTLLHLTGLKDSPNLQKVYYFGPMFRYERPQRFRNREFLQFGVECTSRNFYKNEEVNCIQLLQTYLDTLPINYVLQVNYLGFRSNCLRRLNSLGLKHDRLVFLSDTHQLSDSLRQKVFSYDEEEVLDLIRLLRALTYEEVRFKFNPKLFRGLHYYSRLVFEVKLTSSNKAIVGGGCYDGLWGKLNPRKVNYNHFGWALGLTRLWDVTFNQT